MHIAANSGVSGLFWYLSAIPDIQTFSDSGILLFMYLKGRLIFKALSSVGINITLREQDFSFKLQTRATASWTLNSLFLEYACMICFISSQSDVVEREVSVTTLFR